MATGPPGQARRGSRAPGSLSAPSTCTNGIEVGVRALIGPEARLRSIVAPLPSRSCCMWTRSRDHENHTVRLLGHACALGGQRCGVCIHQVHRIAWPAGADPGPRRARHKPWRAGGAGRKVGRSVALQGRSLCKVGGRLPTHSPLRFFCRPAPSIWAGSQPTPTTRATDSRMTGRSCLWPCWTLCWASRRTWCLCVYFAFFYNDSRLHAARWAVQRRAG